MSVGGQILCYSEQEVRFQLEGIFHAFTGGIDVVSLHQAFDHAEYCTRGTSCQ
jgi:hypothetical protein